MKDKHYLGDVLGPIIGAIAWIVLSTLVFVTSRLFGGESTFIENIKVTTWASFPYISKWILLLPMLLIFGGRVIYRRDTHYGWIKVSSITVFFVYASRFSYDYMVLRNFLEDTRRSEWLFFMERVFIHCSITWIFIFSSPYSSLPFLEDRSVVAYELLPVVATHT
ncbi:hypothetical protein NXZ84_02145 [Mechercharimyces sp. CAU 1602]|nr:hypothetical protein [Mechercharimyces sp. CAU 1602]